MQVWILSKGEFNEGGRILGVYADKELAFADFTTAAREIHDAFTVAGTDQDDDGGVHLHGGCDWLSLEPYDVLAQPQITDVAESQPDEPNALER